MKNISKKIIKDFSKAGKDKYAKRSTNVERRAREETKMKDLDRLAYWEKRFKNACKKKGVVHYHASFITPWYDQTTSEKIASLKEMVKMVGYMDKKHSKNFTDITKEIM